MRNPHATLASALVFIVAFCNNAICGPNLAISHVSGNFAHGESVVIHGIDFGNKTPALPALWDDFENTANTVGTPIGSPVHGNYTRTTGSVYSDDPAYSGARSAYSINDGGTNYMTGLVANWIPNVAQAAFASMKWKIVSAYGSLDPHNIKLIRVNAHHPDPTHGYPNYNIGNERGYTNFQGIVNHGASGQVYVGGFSEDNYHYGDWNSIAIWDLMGAPDQPDGFAGRRINGNSTQRDGIVTNRTTFDFGGLRSAYFCGYIGHGGFDVELWLDDVYADTTLARVELRSSNSCHDMQLPVSWSPTTIEIVCNTGRLAPGTEVQLIVFDSSGNQSPPFAFILGSSSEDPGIPGPPSTVTLTIVE